MTLVRAGEGAPFANLAGGSQMVWLLSLCRRVPPLATLALNIVGDLVRRTSRAVPHLLNAGGLLLLLDSVFRLRRPEGSTGGGDEARAAMAERLGAVRVLSLMASDSRHGAEIADCVCAMLTPRFRYAFEDVSDKFLELFDTAHVSGTAERGNLREWGDEKRDELGALIAAETRRLLEAESVEVLEIIPPAAADASKRMSYVPPPPPATTWLEASRRVEAAWRVAVEL